MNLRQLLSQASANLAEGPHPDRARPDAELMLLHALDRDRAWLLAHLTDPASPQIRDALQSTLDRRRTGEPMQYILGTSEFYGLTLRVRPGVLIPRPETEHLVEEALRLARNLPLPHIPLPHIPSPQILDIGTGSGAIALALAHHLPTAQLTSIDISSTALAVARANAEHLGLAQRVRFLHGDLFAPLASEPTQSPERFHFIVSNPPYIAETDRPALAVEVRDHEPHSALFAGPDGLDLYRRLIPAAPAHLLPGGWLLLEIGHGQQRAVHALLADAGFASIRFHSDLQGIPRVAVAQFS